MSGAQGEAQNKGKWSQEEREKLTELVTSYLNHKQEVITAQEVLHSPHTHTHRHNMPLDICVPIAELEYNDTRYNCSAMLVHL